MISNWYSNYCFASSAFQLRPELPRVHLVPASDATRQRDRCRKPAGLMTLAPHRAQHSWKCLPTSVTSAASKLPRKTQAAGKERRSPANRYRIAVHGLLV